MRLKNRLFWIAAFIAVVLDQITKNRVVEAAKSWQLETIISPKTGEIIYKPTLPLIQGIFHFTYVQNTGAAWSILSGRVDLLRWFSLAVSLALIALACLGPVLSIWEQLGYGLILGGAMGNGIDRFVLSYVVDFLDFRLINFPVFNLADSFISIGVVCLLIASFQKSPTDHRRLR